MMETLRVDSVSDDYHHEPVYLPETRKERRKKLAEPCHCKSGRKYKNCCAKKRAA